nr:cathelicidin [Hoplobatrachus rugulosus]
MKIWQCVFWIFAITLQSAHSESPDQDEWIREALDLYNQKDNGKCFYKQLSDLPAGILEEEEDSPTVRFFIKETECLKSEDIDLAQCDYKKDGQVKACALYPEEGETSKTLKCVSLTKTSRVKRSNRSQPCRGIFCRTGSRSPIAKPSKDNLVRMSLS